MDSRGEGWHELVTDKTQAGGRYRFLLPGGERVPDPASRYQPEDVHGPSQVVNPAAWSWSDAGWKGQRWEEAVVYELHIGTFTPEGTFRGAIRKLDYLASLGITAIEMMPVADFPGRRNWGYDGVLLYAPDSCYGTPEDLKSLVEAAHQRGMMVLQDVVYNHFGPDGNYLSLYAPQFFTGRHKTPWGAAINFDGEGSQAVRQFVIQNALHWVRDYHMDGLRLDAVHTIQDDSPIHILDELAEAVRRSVPDRFVHLILENDANQARRLERMPDGRPKFYTAQWNDDVHHVLHTALTGEQKGYYAEYYGSTEKLGRALAEGFAFQGDMMVRRPSTRGEISRHLPPSAFVAFLQNHDQIGNRPFGDRISFMTSPHAVRAGAAVYLLLPQVPMLFMGEEWNCSQPFPFFCDFGPNLAGAVKDGRREEFSHHPEFQDPQHRERIPDPQADETFESAKLHWEETLEPGHREWLDWYRRILATRHDIVWPLISRILHGGAYEVIGDGAVVVRWKAGEEVVTLSANLSDAAVSGFPKAGPLTIWTEGDFANDGQTFGPWTVRWSLESAGGGESRP
jgi:malto-oligosyltrehalose trehalohydrolase